MQVDNIHIRDEDGFWPALEEYDPKITKQGWKNFINEIEKPDHPSPMKMLVGMLALGGQASCKELSEFGEVLIMKKKMNKNPSL